MKKILTRSALSQPSNLGFSETTREAPLDKVFSFDNYFNHFKPQHIKLNNPLFLEWFIGFSEGDGSFIVSKKRCYFMINQKDIKVLYKIRTSLGFGRVIQYFQNNQKYGRYVVQDQTNCMRLAHIFNGNLVLIKTNARFQLWIKPLNIKPLKRQGSMNLKNGWLSGFIDAEGCFYSRVRKYSRTQTGYKVDRKFSIIQKEEIEFFMSLKDLLLSNAKIQKIFSQDKTSIYYRLEISSFLSNQILLKYLNRFPCLGQKKLNFLVYQRLHWYIEGQQHLTLSGLKKIEKLCQRLKKSESFFENDPI